MLDILYRLVRCGYVYRAILLKVDGTERNTFSVIITLYTLHLIQLLHYQLSFKLVNKQLNVNQQMPYKVVQCLPIQGLECRREDSEDLYENFTAHGKIAANLPHNNHNDTKMPPYRVKQNHSVRELEKPMRVDESKLC